MKSVRSPDRVVTDLNLAPGQCKARIIDAAAGLCLPDPACTPGAIDPTVTQENLASTICKSGYTATVRAPASDTNKTKALEPVTVRADPCIHYRIRPPDLAPARRHQRRLQPLARTQLRRSARHHQPQGLARDPAEQGRLRAQGHPRCGAEGDPNWVTAEKDLGL